MAKELPREDTELIERLRQPATCRQAFNEVMRLYSEPLYWQVRRMVENHDDANDILQNTFLKAWQSVAGFRGDAKLSTWLYKIALNEAITFLARERKRLSLSLDDEESHLVNLIESDEYVDGDELALKLRMSEILGTSVGALKASYHLAVKKIEQYITAHD